MSLENRKKTYANLGSFLTDFIATLDKDLSFNHPLQEELYQLVLSAKNYNGWFTPTEVKYAIHSWAKALQSKNIEQWLAEIDLTATVPKKIGLVMAGNIPLVGLHDFLSVLICGHSAQVKLSSNDKLLLPLIGKILIELDASFADKFEFTQERLTNFDAVIATGSNNTARYFEYYFRSKPNIIRKNRNSVAILTGDETTEELELLAEDIFRYYGLGCRSVSKLYVPKNYDFDAFYKAMYPKRDIINHNKYANNYDYNKAVYLMSDAKLLDNGFLILKEDKGLSSPIACVFHEAYEDLNTLENELKSREEELQCIVGNSQKSAFINVDFGKTQQPELWDYADGINTLEFLSTLE
ncbi:MAG: acyl-CoA reductase [Bacteroidota bacterium]